MPNSRNSGELVEPWSFIRGIIAGVSLSFSLYLAVQVFNSKEALPTLVDKMAQDEALRATFESRGMVFEKKYDAKTGKPSWHLSSIRQPRPEVSR